MNRQRHYGVLRLPKRHYLQLLTYVFLLCYGKIYVIVETHALMNYTSVVELIRKQVMKIIELVKAEDGTSIMWF